MKQTKGRGFTLIELLVVIAIIGILASVVLASLNTARDKGSNAALKGALAQLRSQAELFYDTPRSYTGLCADTTITNILANAQANSVNSGATPIVTLAVQTATQVTCHVNAAGNAYAVSAPLKADEGTESYYCVDSTGAARAVDTVLAANDVVCPAT